MSPTRAVGVALTLLLAGGVPACGADGSSSAPSASPSSSSPSGSSASSSEREGGEKAGEAADTTTCVADARPWTGTAPAGFARDFPLPPGAVLTGVQDRGADGVVATAVVRAGLRTVLAHLNGPAQTQGFEVTEGETEEHDAEANWTGHGYRGRWAIRDSATCPGEVILQLLSKRQ
ncbi:MAG: hypothetical protein JWR42_1723 [Marmoricola sp.]|nr:hypothetical protein [Marmoricola sp.]